ncbi:hypothetical protein HNR46_001867, partial [Haloferula luteola]|nr:hypothetical protein [Haloferula luteola]
KRAMARVPRKQRAGQRAEIGLEQGGVFRQFQQGADDQLPARAESKAQ